MPAYQTEVLTESEFMHSPARQKAYMLFFLPACENAALFFSFSLSHHHLFSGEARTPERMHKPYCSIHVHCYNLSNSLLYTNCSVFPTALSWYRSPIFP